jgi:TFIIF-interacting CTD phosphatase-like protein
MKNIILDLDNTLICAVEVEEITSANRPALPSFDVDGVYTVFERPGLEEFLEYLFKNFNVYVWSAGTKNYVMSIIEHVFESRGYTPKGVFFLYHCNLSEKSHECLKDLSMFAKCTGVSYKDTYLIDDLEETIEKNGEQGILIAPFEALDAGADKDTELTTIKNKLKGLYK